MSGAKFYVLGGGRWRELDTGAGRVEGWGSARFLYVERGRLRAVRRAPVLRGLRALAAGRPSNVHDGAPLSQIRYIKAVKNKHISSEQHAPCQHAYYGCGVNAPYNMQPQAPGAVHAAVQADLALQRHEPPARTPRRRSITYNTQHHEIKKKKIVQNKKTEIIVPNRNNKTLNSSDEDLSDSIMEWNRKSEKPETRGAELCKELLIAEDDIMLLRNFIEKDEKNVFKVDLERFDADDTYKSNVFYKLNPLVNVERCKAIADMTWEQRSQSTVTLKDFITNLGLKRVDDPSPSGSRYRMRKRRDALNTRETGSEQDKENLSSKRQPKVNKRSKVLGESVGSKPNSDRVKGKVKASEASSRATRGSRRQEDSVVVELSDSENSSERRVLAASPEKDAARHKRGAGGREYTAAEDAAIVRWLRAAGRGHLVNGNRLWRELQPEHQRLTGHFRSWHSLRNRYLRYVLPSLGALLPAPAAAALRAAAVRGEIKARPPPRTRHSLLAPPPVHGAWARRPRPGGPTHGSAPDDEPHRSLQSNGPTAPAHGDTPTYSELTKRFAERHHSTPDSDASEITEPEKLQRRSSKRLRISRNADSSIRLDDVSSRQTNTSDRSVENSGINVDIYGKGSARSDRSNRNTHNSNGQAVRSLRNTDTRSQTTDSTDRREHRARRLYNHNH